MKHILTFNQLNEGIFDFFKETDDDKIVKKIINNIDKVKIHYSFFISKSKFFIEISICRSNKTLP